MWASPWGEQACLTFSFHKETTGRHDISSGGLRGSFKGLSFEDTQALKALQGTTSVRCGWQKEDFRRNLQKSNSRRRDNLRVCKNRSRFHRLWQDFLSQGEESLADKVPGDVAELMQLKNGKSCKIGSLAKGVSDYETETPRGPSFSGGALNKPAQGMTRNSIQKFSILSDIHPFLTAAKVKPGHADKTFSGTRKLSKLWVSNLYA
uniref:Uncharacterized protein n=1 Tax=Tetraselmis sp. GSL018 TaxID=582737 RepID=A0A061RHQ2_9CHLO